MAKIEEKIEKLIIAPVEAIGYKIYDVEYLKEGKDYHLRVFIEKENEEIKIEDCEKVSNEINEIIDEADIIKEQYFLEISSTGIEKTIKKDKHLKREINNKVKVNLFKKDEKGQKEYIGILNKFNEETIELQKEATETQEEEKILIKRKDISQIKTIYNWKK